MSGRGATAMLAALDLATTPTEPSPAMVTPGRRPAGSRAGLKHIGGYLDTDAVEKMALLKIRLELDNSEVLTKAIDMLFAQENARRAFGG